MRRCCRTTPPPGYLCASYPTDPQNVSASHGQHRLARGDYEFQWLPVRAPPLARLRSFFSGMISNSSVSLRQQPHRTYLTGAPHTAAMSLASNLDARSHQQESAAATYAGWRVCIIVLTLFIAVATLSAIRKD